MMKEWLEEYEPKTQAEVEQALREIMQEIALAGLQRSGFFEKAAFYGGTALRLFYGLDRFSEDLDFSLLEVNPDFSLKPYLEGIITEFSALGMQVSVKEKVKTKQTNIDSAFLKSDTVWKELIVEGVVPQAGIGIRPSIQIKIEVDTHPPLGFETEEKLLLKPFSFFSFPFLLLRFHFLEGGPLFSSRLKLQVLLLFWLLFSIDQRLYLQEIPYIYLLYLFFHSLNFLQG